MIVHVRLKYFMDIFSLESQLKKTSYQKYKPVWHNQTWQFMVICRLNSIKVWNYDMNYDSTLWYYSIKGY